MPLGSVSIGEIIDERYRVTGVLGSGGMGTVYGARELLLDREVAVKVINQVDAADEDSIARFKREAAVLSRLTDKSIIRVLRYGIWQKTAYLVMELLQGKSLEQLLAEKHNLDPRQALQIAMKVATGLSAVHAAKIVHRDLKPANVFITNNAEIKLLDFGLCKLVPSSPEEVQRLTQTGILLGSVHYMSPEMCRGKQADSRADIYALGIILFQMLTGATPFDCDNPVGLLYKHITDPIPLLKDRYPFLPLAAEIDKILQRCLAKDPAERYQSAGEVYGALEELLKDLPEGAPLSMSVQTTPKTKSSASSTFIMFCLIGLACLLIVPASCAKLVELPALFMKQERACEYQIQAADTFSKSLHLIPHASALLLDLANNSKERGDSLWQAYALCKLAALEKNNAVPDIAEALDILVTAPTKNIAGDSEKCRLLNKIVKSACEIIRHFRRTEKSKFMPICDKLLRKYSNIATARPIYPLAPEAGLPLALLIVDICDEEMKGYYYRCLGNTYSQLGMTKEGLASFAQAFDLFRISNDWRGQFYSVIGMLDCCCSGENCNSANFISAIEYCAKIEQLFKSLRKDPGAEKDFHDSLRLFCLLKVHQSYLLTKVGRIDEAALCLEFIDSSLPELKRTCRGNDSSLPQLERTYREKNFGLDEMEKALNSFRQDLPSKLALLELNKLGDYINKQADDSSMCYGKLKGWHLVLNAAGCPETSEATKAFQVEHSGEVVIPTSMLPLIHCQGNLAIFRVLRYEGGRVSVKLRKPLRESVSSGLVVNELVRKTGANSAAVTRAWLANVCQDCGIFQLVKESRVIMPETGGKADVQGFSLSGLPLTEGKPIVNLAARTSRLRRW